MLKRSENLGDTVNLEINKVRFSTNYWLKFFAAGCFLELFLCIQ